MRADTSLSLVELRKHLTGRSDVEIDRSKISISPSGQVQPAEPPRKPPCAVANFGDEIEDLGERLIAMSPQQLRSLWVLFAERLT